MAVDIVELFQIFVALTQTSDLIRELAMVMLLKCADLSHVVMSTKVHVAWSACLNEEVHCPRKMQTQTYYESRSVKYQC
jgi:hypothetical protein